MMGGGGIREFLPDIPLNDSFQREFYWLKCPWPSLSWSVRDPVAEELEKQITINFDWPVIGDELAAEKKQVIEDIKRSLALSVEMSRHGNYMFGCVLSFTMMRKRVQILKRVYRELSEISLSSMSELDSESMKLLLMNLSKPETESRKYGNRISEYLETLDISLWPIRSYTQGRGATIDRERVCLELGFDANVSKTSSNARAVFNKANLELARIYPEQTWLSVAEDTFQEEPPRVSYSKYFSDILSVLDSYYKQSQIEGLFNYPLMVQPVVSTFEDTIADYFPIPYRPGRTRNIPVEMWMPLMDAAVLYVVDYAEPLKTAEEEATRYYDEVSSRRGRHAAGKETGLWLRQKNFTSGRYSPFPLSSYANYKKRRGSKYTSEFLDKFQKLINSGSTPKEIKEELGLRKTQYDYIRTLIMSSKVDPGTSLSLHRARYCFLPLCCVLILLAFTAGRELSIATLKAGCIKRRYGELYIDMFIPKSLRRYDSLPTVEIVEKAVNVLEEMSASARKENNDDHLFQFLSFRDQKSGSQGFRWEADIDDFIRWLGLDVGGEKFKFSEHQFRRFFVIMYFYKYDKKYKINSLMRFMRHLDWEQVSIYLSEKSSGQVLKDIADEKGAALIESAWRGDAGGLMAEEFKTKLNQSLAMRTEQRAKFALATMEKGEYVFDFVCDGVCFGRTPGLEDRAMCKLDVAGEVHIMTHRQSQGSCIGCKNLLTTSELEVDRQTEPKLEMDSQILSAALGGL